MSYESAFIGGFFVNWLLFPEWVRMSGSSLRGKKMDS